MLTTVLPGIRELRAPLAAGALWLVLVLVILVGRYGPIALTPQGALGPYLDSVRTLGGGSAVLLSTGVGFAAYCVGLISIQLWSALETLLIFAYEAVAAPVRRRMGRYVVDYSDNHFELVEELLSQRFERDRDFAEMVTKRLNEDPWALSRSVELIGSRAVAVSAGGYWTTSLPGDGDVHGLSDEQKDELASALVDAAKTRLPLREVLVRSTVDVSHYAELLSAEIQCLPTLMSHKAQPTFDLWDRQQNEADFRRAVAVPMVLGAPLAATLGPLPPVASLVILLVGVTFFRMGHMKQQEALRALETAYRSGLVESPFREQVLTEDVRWKAVEC